MTGWLNGWIDGHMDPLETSCPKVRKLCLLGGAMPQVFQVEAIAEPSPTVLCACDYDRQVTYQHKQVSDDINVGQYHSSAK